MKKPDDLDLDRLLARACEAGNPAGPESMPEKLRTRVLASWRSILAEQTQAKLHAASLALMFRRALCCAAVLMLASVALCLALDPDDDIAMDIAASALNSPMLADNSGNGIDGPNSGLSGPTDAVP